jgi:UPF0716 family protein affecting phage T7 exclusion
MPGGFMNNLIKSGLKTSVLGLFLLTAVPSAQATVYVRVQAPELRVENHDERKGFVWQSGYWRWHGQKHEWTAGHYAREQRGRHWTDGRWDHNERGYYWVGGRWNR